MTLFYVCDGCRKTGQSKKDFPFCKTDWCTIRFCRKCDRNGGYCERCARDATLPR